MKNKLVIPEDKTICNCSNNNLTQLKLNDNLERLYCNNNQLTELTLNDKLKWLDCSYNQLTQLTLNDKLEWLSCDIDVDVNNINNNELDISFHE